MRTVCARGVIESNSITSVLTLPRHLVTVCLSTEEGGRSSPAPRSLWSVPAHTTRGVVTLRVSPAPAAARHAYVRIKLAGVAAPLVLCVELAPAPPGLLLAPHMLYYHVKGAGDPPTQVAPYKSL